MCPDAEAALPVIPADINVQFWRRNSNDGRRALMLMMEVFSCAAGCAYYIAAERLCGDDE